MAALSRLSVLDADGFPLPNEVGVPDYIAEFAADTGRMRDERQARYLASLDTHGPATVDRSPVGEWVNGVWRQTHNKHHERLAAFHGWLAARGD